MAVFLTRGRKAPYQQHVGFSLENYLSTTTRAELRKRLSETNDIPRSLRSDLESLLENDTVTVWGAQEKHAEIFAEMCPGDTAIFIDTADSMVAHLMQVDMVLGSEVPEDLRHDISSHIWRSPDFKYIWLSQTKLQRLNFGTDSLEALIQRADPSFEFPDDWFSMGDDFHLLESEVLAELGGTEAFLEELKSDGYTEISPNEDGHLVVDEENIVGQSHWTVAAKFTDQNGIESESDDFEPYKEGDDPRIQYHLLPRSSDAASRIQEYENNAEVLIRSGSEIIKQGRLATIEGKRIDGSTYDLATIFEVRDTPLVPLTPVLEDDRGRPLDPTKADVITLQPSEYVRFLKTAHGIDLAAGVETVSDREPLQSEIYRDAAAHLVAGRSVVFYGPPGTGKTRAAQQLTNALNIGLNTATANAEWTNYDVVGGYKPAGPDTTGEWAPSAGFLTEAALTSVDTLAEAGVPHWLLVDEINRANLDQAFGNVFTLLDIDYRQEQSITFGDSQVYLPYSFRILATMNTSDRSKLFSLGYAFRRRFAFVRVPSMLDEGDDRSYGTAAVDGPEVDVPNRSQIRHIVENAVKDDLTRARILPTAWDETDVPPRDAAPIDPGYAITSVIEEGVEAVTSGIDFGWPRRDPIDVTLEFMRLLSEDEYDVVEVGHAIAIDVARYLVAAQLLADNDISRATVDRALVAYLLPQIDVFMSELRKEETIEVGASDGMPPSERYEKVIEWADEMGLPLLAAELDAARDSYSVI